MIVWLVASKNGLTSPIVLKPGETLLYKNYIEIVLPHVQSQGKRLIGKDFIYQQDSSIPHTYTKLLAWCEENFVHFINYNRWTPNSPVLNTLANYV
jgi:hypothetical protein